MRGMGCPIAGSPWRAWSVTGRDLESWMPFDKPKYTTALGAAAASRAPSQGPAGVMILPHQLSETSGRFPSDRFPGSTEARTPSSVPASRNPPEGTASGAPGQE